MTLKVSTSTDAVYNASRTSKTGVYFVGPHGARVSFASQQRRVLNLLYVLEHAKKKLTPHTEKCAAVVGAGIAGLMAAAALLMKGYNVALYDKEMSVLNVQRHTRHRWVHPTINFWPHDTLSWTTTFPFLDWHAANCSDIIGMIEQDWKVAFARKISQYFFGEQVVGFGSKGKRPTVQSVKLVSGKIPALATPDSRDYDLVIVTTGFGPEKNAGDANQVSYWAQDKIDDLAHRTNQQFVVSGTGDGGTIDALRLAYPDFMRKELALSYLRIIDEEALREKVKEVEETALGKPNLNTRSVYYDREYRKIARERTLEAKTLLPDLTAEKLPVLLIGRHPTPFEVTSAPIHRIILAHALNTGLVRYQQGEVTFDGSGYFITPADGAIQPLAQDAIVIRHGATPPTGALLGEAGAKRLSMHQAVYGDFLVLDGLTRDAFSNPDLYPNPGTAEFADMRASHAWCLLDDQWDIDVKGVALADAGHFSFETVMRSHSDPRKTPLSLSLLPDSLYGIELSRPMAAEPPISSGVERRGSRAGK